MKYIKTYERYRRFIDRKYWIVKADDLYIGMILKELNIYDEYKTSYINNEYIKELGEIIIAIRYNIENDRIVVEWDNVIPERIKYWNEESFVYSGEIKTIEDIIRFKNEIELDNNINKFNI